MIYTIIFSILFILSLGEIFFHETLRKFNSLFFWVFVIGFTLLAGLRYDVGGDIQGYKNIYNSIPALLGSNLTTLLNSLKTSHAEPLFALLTSVIKIIGNFQFFLLAVSFLISFFLLRFIFVNIEYPIFATLVYFSTGFKHIHMHYIRAGLAIAFFLGISKEKFWQQSPRKLIINSLIASCIHFTALLFTFSLLFMKNKKRMIFLFFLAALSVSVFCFKIPFSHLIGKHIAGVLNFQRVQYYVDKMYSDVWGPVLRIYGRTILYFMIGIFFYFRNVKNKKKLVNFVIAISIVGLIVNTLFWDFGLIYGRLVTYFSLVPLVLIPYGLGMVKLKYSRVVMGFLVLILFFYLFYLSFYITKAHEILFPYEYCTDLGLNMKN